MDCTQCEYFERYSGKEYQGATWRCKNEERIKDSSYNAHWCENSIANICSLFIPKLPNNDKSRQPVEKVEKTYGRCKNAGNQHICCTCDDFRNFQPIPKTINPEESKGKDCEKCRNYIKCVGEDTLIKAVNCVKYKPKRKEKKMWNKLRKRGRRITMAWDLFGVFLLCKLVNPWVLKFWHFVLPVDFWDNDNSNDFQISWLLTIASIAAILGSLYALDRLAAWWYGEK